ncbi:MAG TPA: LysE family transporter [Sedimentisphaerales bacterium]|nr:LysE family transporter [Sedimentisphaerales bacterium]
MDSSIFFKGIVVGFLVATPLGPIAVLCIQRTLNEGKIHGMVSGLGAATADALYGLIAAFGLTFVSNFLVKEQLWLRVGGGILLCYMGGRIFLSRPVQRAASGNGASYTNNYISTFLLTLANPGTFIAFAAMFAGFGLVQANGHYASAGLLVAGVFVGSEIWWLILSSVAATFLQRLGYGKLSWLNKIAGIVIAGFGLFVLLSLI